MTAQDVLISELDSEETALYKAGRTNHKTDLALFFIAIAASFVATILVGKDLVPVWATAAIAGSPAFCATLQKVIDFRGRAAWYFRKAARMKALSLSLKYEGTSVPDAAKAFGEIETAFEDLWPRLVSTGAAPASPLTTAEQTKGAVPIK